MLRCQNCGWYNPEDAKECEKCGEPLEPEYSKEDNFQEPVKEPVKKGKPLSKTVKFEAGALEAITQKAPSVCPRCNYPYTGSPKICPNCGTNLKGTTKKDAVEPEVQPAAEPVAEPAVKPADGRNAFKATVMESAAPAASAHPAKQNLFNATVRETSAPASKPATDKGKRTIREIPAELKNEDTGFHLVPLSGMHPTIDLVPGQVVTINGIQYRFIK